MNSSDTGVSPTTSVILLVALTVSLASLAAFHVFNVTGKMTSTEASGALEISQTNASSVKITVTKNENVNGFYVEKPNGNFTKNISQIGESLTINNLNPGDELIIYSVTDKTNTTHVSRVYRVK